MNRILYLLLNLWRRIFLMSQQSKTNSKNCHNSRKGCHVKEIALSVINIVENLIYRLIAA